MPQVLTSSYLTSLISPWLWATKNSGCTCGKAPRSPGQHHSWLPPSHGRPCPVCRCSAILCHKQNALPPVHKLRCFSADGSGCGLKTPNSPCCYREKPAEPEITNTAAGSSISWSSLVSEHRAMPPQLLLGRTSPQSQEDFAGRSLAQEFTAHPRKAICKLSFAKVFSSGKCHGTFRGSGDQGNQGPPTWHQLLRN